VTEDGHGNYGNTDDHSHYYINGKQNVTSACGYGVLLCPNLIEIGFLRQILVTASNMEFHGNPEACFQRANKLEGQAQRR
jgi:hypothetical protein